jgi:phosphoesterase RecJ-like protein
MIPDDAHKLFRTLCAAAEHCVITTHLNPDGDAVGSETGLASYLLSLGKRVDIVNQDPTPKTLAFIESPSAPVSVYDAAVHDALLEKVDLLLLVDNSAPDRLGRMERVMSENHARTLCIDHHPTRDAPWAHNIVDVSSSATAAMIFELTRPTGFVPDAAAAQAMYAGLATDTGFFRFNSTSARSHEIAAELLRLGATPAPIYEQIYERNSEAYTRLLGHALSEMRVEAEGDVASVRITRDLLRSLNAQQVDTSEITTALLALDGVQIVALFRELSGSRVKVSLRSKGDLDVHALATEFGGGGHHNASGIVMPGALDETADRVLARAIELAATRPGVR